MVDGERKLSLYPDYQLAWKLILLVGRLGVWRDVAHRFIGWLVRVHIDERPLCYISNQLQLFYFNDDTYGLKYDMKRSHCQ